MMIKVFTKNKNDKIELTEKELKEILDEAYWDGYYANMGTTYTYRTPNRWYDPYIYTTESNSSSTTITLNSNTNTPTLNNSCTVMDEDH